MSIKKKSSIDSKELLTSILKNRADQINKNRSRKRRVTTRNIENLRQKISNFVIGDKVKVSVFPSFKILEVGFKAK